MRTSLYIDYVLILIPTHYLIPRLKLIMKKLHIYLDYSTQQEIEKIRQKYHVSLSTFVDVAFNEMITTFQLLPQYNKLKSEYLTEDKKTCTTIALNKDNQNLWFYDMNLTSDELMHLITNLIYLHIREYNQIEKNVGKEFINKKRMQINNKLKEKREMYWDYNKIYRSHIRAKKQYDREYAK